MKNECDIRSYLADNRVMPRILELRFEDGAVFETTALNGLPWRRLKERRATM